MGVVGSMFLRWLLSALPVSSRRRCSAVAFDMEGLAAGELTMRKCELLLLCRLAGPVAPARCWRVLAADATPCGLAFGLTNTELIGLRRR